MIQFSLTCGDQHRFDAWFRNAQAYDEQRAQGIVTCPICGSTEVDKALMAPNVARPTTDKTASTAAPPSIAATKAHPRQAEIMAMLREIRRRVTSEADYVGNRFAEEARKIHFDEAEARGIYGEATQDEVAELLEDGIDFLPLPDLPEEAN